MLRILAMKSTSKRPYQIQEKTDFLLTSKKEGGSQFFGIFF